MECAPHPAAIVVSRHPYRDALHTSNPARAGPVVDRLPRDLLDVASLRSGLERSVPQHGAVHSAQKRSRAVAPATCRRTTRTRRCGAEALEHLSAPDGDGRRAVSRARTRGPTPPLPGWTSPAA